MNWGMVFNGRCLTAKITECRKIASGFSLSDILEEHPGPKYFLSEKSTEEIFKKSRRVWGTPKGSIQSKELQRR